MKKLLTTLTLLVIVVFGAKAQWQQTSLDTTDIACIAISGNNIFAGTGSRDGVYLSTNNGSSWSVLSFPIGYASLSAYLSLVIKGDTIFAGAYGSGVFMSSNNGSSCTPEDNGFLTTANLGFFALVINGNNIFVGTGNVTEVSFTGGVYMSSNNGSSWSDVNNGFPLYPNVYPSVRALLIKGDTIFAGTSSNGIYLSSLNGNNWSAVNNGLPYDSVNGYTEIDALVKKNDTIFAGTWGSGVYVSLNNGQDWTAINTGLPDNSGVFALAIGGNSIFAGTLLGIYMSKNNGQLWSEVNTGFPDSTIVTSIAIKGDTLYAGTEYYGVWKCAISELVGIKEVNNNAINISVYPNPATNTLTIDIPQAAVGSMQAAVSNIAIYNLLGEEVYSATNNKLQTTNNIDVSALPCGVYVVEVRTEKGVSVNKFIKE